MVGLKVVSNIARGLLIPSELGNSSEIPVGIAELCLGVAWQAHSLLTVARPGVLWYLQEPGELAVPIVDVLITALVTQRIDAVAQGQQRAVDVGSFLHALPPVLCLERWQRIAQ